MVRREDCLAHGAVKALWKVCPHGGRSTLLNPCVERATPSLHYDLAKYMDSSAPRKLKKRKHGGQISAMWYLALKAGLSGILIAAISEVAKRYPGIGALIASLPLVSVMGMIWLWHDRPDAANMAAHAEATFWFVLPSLPMFLLLPMLMRHGVGFWVALVTGCALTIALYTGMTWLGPRFGLRL